MAHQRQLSPTVFLDKMRRIYLPMSILVRREQERYFFRLKAAVNYGTVKRQAGEEVSSFEVSSLERFFRSTTVDVISSEEDTTENTKYPTARQRLEILINKFLSFSVFRHAATGKFSGEQ